MDYALGVIIFIVGLLISIALHEVGHLVPAKVFGVKVPEYFVGFGRTLWSTTRGETVYGIKALPLGGYVRLAGMYPPASGEPARKANGDLTLAEEARADARSDLLPGEEDRAFSALTVPRKLVVMLGGPVMNLAIAAVLLTVMFTVIGSVPAYTSTIATVQPCLPAPDAVACQEDDPASPAAAAGFEPGDTVVSWSGTPVSAWSDVTQLIRDGGTEPADVVVRRGGEEITLTVSPAELERAVIDDQGNPVVEDGVAVTEVVPYVGIGPTMELETQPLSAVPPVFWDATVQTLGLIPQLPVLLWDVAESLVTGEEREGGVLGPVGVGRAAGEIAATSSAVYGLEARIFDMLGLVASLNIALFAFNLIPLPPLDGGHVAGALVEGVRRGAARLAGRADPGPVDMARALPLTYAVVALLIGMGVLLAVADIVRPVTF